MISKKQFFSAVYRHYHIHLMIFVKFWDSPAKCRTTDFKFQAVLEKKKAYTCISSVFLMKALLYNSSLDC